MTLQHPEKRNLSRGDPHWPSLSETGWGASHTADSRQVARQPLSRPTMDASHPASSGARLSIQDSMHHGLNGLWRPPSTSMPERPARTSTPSPTAFHPHPVAAVGPLEFDTSANVSSHDTRHPQNQTSRATPARPPFHCLLRVLVQTVGITPSGNWPCQPNLTLHSLPCLDA